MWNALEKLAVRDPETFVDYYANDVIALVSRAWLGPAYQVTSQVNVVRPGGQAQDPHRDYHLGFMDNDRIEQYPTHVHLLSPVLTLQGAVAHSDMPVESGPTMYLPHSHKYVPGYLAWRRRSSASTSSEHYVQLPLAKGDAAFFNPALFHGAGTNVSADIQRVANLLQVSSAFGRAMETVDRDRVVRAVYPALLDRAAQGVRPPRDRGVCRGLPVPDQPRPRPAGRRPHPAVQAEIVAEAARAAAPRQTSWRAGSTGTPRGRDTSAMSLLADKVVLVSGGTQGVGAAIARAAVDEGATVAVSGRRRDAVGRPSPPSSRNAAAAARRTSPPTSPTSRRRWPVSRRSCSGSAGSTAWSTPPGSPAAGRCWTPRPSCSTQHVAVNLRAPFFLMQAAVQDMRRRAGTRHDRQRHHHVRARRPALPRAVRRHQGRPGRA